jgi:hypothetical protein
MNVKNLSPGHKGELDPRPDAHPRRPILECCASVREMRVIAEKDGPAQEDPDLNYPHIGHPYTVHLKGVPYHTAMHKKVAQVPEVQTRSK